MTLNRGPRVALVGIVFVAIGLVMDLAHLDSTTARAVFFAFMLLAIGAAAWPPARSEARRRRHHLADASADH